MEKKDLEINNSQYGTMSNEEKLKLMEICKSYRESLLRAGGCPPDKLRVPGKLYCFHCPECWEAAIKKDLGIK
jgi:hypothetical protein